MDAGGSANGEAKAAIETALQTFIEDEIPIEFRNVTAQHLLPRLLTAVENRDFFADKYILLALSFSHVSVNQFQIGKRFVLTLCVLARQIAVKRSRRDAIKMTHW